MRADVIDVLIEMRWATGGLLQDVRLSRDSLNMRSNAINYPTTLTDSSQQIRVRWGDTANKLLAQHTKFSDVSQQQLLLALLHANPHAFVDNNVNRLKTGVLLTMPVFQEANAIILSEATLEIRYQNKRFRTFQASHSKPPRAAGSTK